MYDANTRLGEMKKQFIQDYPMVYDDTKLEYAAAEKKALDVDISGVVLYPSFQLTTDGDVFPAVPRILKIADENRIQNWSVALWFALPCQEDTFKRAPLELIDDEDKVVGLFNRTVESSMKEDADE
jgi:hypothetical protein